MHTNIGEITTQNKHGSSKNYLRHCIKQINSSEERNKQPQQQIEQGYLGKKYINLSQTRDKKNQEMKLRLETKNQYK